MQKLFTYLLTTCFGVFSAVTISAESFDYIEAQGNSLETTHELRAQITVNPVYNLVGESHYKAVFNNHPFAVSLIAFSQGDRLISIHAEIVTDMSGYLDYSYLTPIEVGGAKMYFDSKCVALTDSQVDEAKDLRYFKNNGFNFSPFIYLNQYFITSKTGNAELVITLAQKVADCVQQNQGNANELENYLSLKLL